MFLCNFNKMFLKKKKKEEKCCIIVAPHFLLGEVIFVVLPSSLNSLKINILT